MAITGAGGCGRVRRGAVESVLTLAFGGTGFRGFAVIGTHLAELALYSRLEVTRLTSCGGRMGTESF